MPAESERRVLKQEMEDDTEQGAAKRARIFNEIQRAVDTPESRLGVITSIKDIADDLVRELYKIAAEAVKAHSEDHQPSPAMMEEFFGAMFRGWDSDEPVPHPTLPVPHNSNTILRFTPGRSVGEAPRSDVAYYQVCLRIDPPELSFCIRTRNARDGSGASLKDCQRILWHQKTARVDQYNDMMCAFLVYMSNAYKAYNSQQAVYNARRLVRKHALGSEPEQPYIAAEYASFVEWIQMFPVLSVGFDDALDHALFGVEKPARIPTA